METAKLMMNSALKCMNVMYRSTMKLFLPLSLSLSPSPQVTSGHRIEENLQQQLSEKRQQIVNLEHQISRYRDEIATLKGHLATSDEVSLHIT